MSVESDVYTTLAGLVEGKCYPVIAPDSPATPYIVYTVITGVPVVSLDGLSGLTRKRMQIDVWADTYESQKTIESQVSNAMESADFENVPIMVHDNYEVETKLYRSIMEYSIYG